jgi:hypothetical protein
VSVPGFLAALLCFATLLGAENPATAPVAVLVNQIGYDTGRTKTLVVQVRDPLTDAPAWFELIDDRGQPRFRGELVPGGRIHEGSPSDWGANYWTGDFSRFEKPGKYRARVRVGAGVVESFPFRIGKRLLFAQTAEFAARFFYWQRCGYPIPGVHAACHLDDGMLEAKLGGGHRDVTGGWHDAGDYNKYNGYTPASVLALATLARSEWMTAEARRQLLDEAVWGGEFIYKMWQPAKGILYNEVFSGWAWWGPPEKETDNLPGNADDRPIRGEGPNPMAAAAMAALARGTGVKKYREAAQDLWRGAAAAIKDAPSPHLLLAALELHALTGERRYHEAARKQARALLQARDANGLWRPDIGEHGIRPAALALYARAYAADEVSGNIRTALRRWVERSLALSENPFRLTPYAEGVFFRPYEEKNEWYVGQNTMYLSQAWALYLVGDLLREPRAGQLADRQLDWVLGVNPFNLCMMEGKGSFNLPLYHHAYTGNSRRKLPGIPGQQRGAIPGAIPNGVARAEGQWDKPFLFFGVITTLPPAPPPMHTTEPWLPHNAYYLQAMAARSAARR